MADFTIDDMINSAIESKPETFKDAFSNIMAAKVAQAVEDRKQELASTMFSDEQEEQEDSDEYQDSIDLEQDETEVENAEDTETDS